MRLAVPLRALTQRFAFLFLIMTAFGLMLLGKAETVLVERVRTGVVDVVAPILDVLSRPAATVAEAVENVRQLTELRNENLRLQAQNQRLMQWQQAARKLASENTSLRELLKFVPGPRTQHATARVIANAGGVFLRSVLVNAGARDGVGKGQAAVTGDGLVGRVASVGDRSARVLLVTDLNSRIPVILEDTRARAIVAGDNSDKPWLTFLNSNQSPTPGARVVTSGHGGVFPPGLPVGFVSAVSKEGIRIQPFVDLNRLEYVRIIDARISAPPDPTGPRRPVEGPR